MDENNKEIIENLIANLDVSIKNFCNEHSVKIYAPKLLKYQQDACNSSTPNSGGDSGPHSLPKGFIGSEFSTSIT